MLAGDRGQHRERGRQAQVLNSEVPPPAGRRPGRDGVSREGGVEDEGSRGQHRTGDHGTTSPAWDVLTRASSPRGPSPSGSLSVASTCHSGTWTCRCREVSRARQRVSAAPTPRGTVLRESPVPSVPTTRHAGAPSQAHTHMCTHSGPAQHTGHACSHMEWGSSAGGSQTQATCPWNPNLGHPPGVAEPIRYGTSAAQSGTSPKGTVGRGGEVSPGPHPPPPRSLVQSNQGPCFRVSLAGCQPGDQGQAL